MFHDLKFLEVPRNRPLLVDLTERSSILYILESSVRYDFRNGYLP